MYHHFSTLFKPLILAACLISYKNKFGKKIPPNYRGQLMQLKLIIKDRRKAIPSSSLKFGSDTFSDMTFYKKKIITKMFT